jgi:DNA-binding XRE family transcriptional regulator
MKTKALQENKGFKTDTIADILRGDRSILILELCQLIEWRKKYGFSQQDMATNCGVSVSTIKRFEAMKVDSLSLYWNYKQLFY